jgi:hypothetical protein
VIVEEDLGVVSCEIEDPQQLERLQRHEADVEVQGVGNNALFVTALDYLFNLPRVVREVVDEGLFMRVVLGDGQPPNPDIAVGQSDDRVFIVAAEVDRDNRVLFLCEVVYSAFQCEFLKGIEVDIENGPDVEEIVGDMKSVAFVPLQQRVLLNGEVMFLFDAEFHAGEEFCFFDVGDDVDFEGFDLFGADE